MRNSVSVKKHVTLKIKIYTHLLKDRAIFCYRNRPGVIYLFIFDTTFFFNNYFNVISIPILTYKNVSSVNYST